MSESLPASRDAVEQIVELQSNYHNMIGVAIGLVILVLLAVAGLLIAWFCYVKKKKSIKKCDSNASYVGYNTSTIARGLDMGAGQISLLAQSYEGVKDKEPNEGDVKAKEDCEVVWMDEEMTVRQNSKIFDNLQTRASISVEDQDFDIEKSIFDPNDRKSVCTPMKPLCLREDAHVVSESKIKNQFQVHLKKQLAMRSDETCFSMNSSLFSEVSLTSDKSVTKANKQKEDNIMTQDDLDNAEQNNNSKYLSQVNLLMQSVNEALDDAKNHDAIDNPSNDVKINKDNENLNESQKFEGEKLGMVENVEVIDQDFVSSETLDVENRALDDIWVKADKEECDQDCNENTEDDKNEEETTDSQDEAVESNGDKKQQIDLEVEISNENVEENDKVDASDTKNDDDQMDAPDSPTNNVKVRILTDDDNDRSVLCHPGSEFEFDYNDTKDLLNTNRLEVIRQDSLANMMEWDSTFEQIKTEDTSLRLVRTPVCERSTKSFLRRSLNTELDKSGVETVTTRKRSTSLDRETEWAGQMDVVKICLEADRQMDTSQICLDAETDEAGQMDASNISVEGNRSTYLDVSQIRSNSFSIYFNETSTPRQVKSGSNRALNETPSPPIKFKGLCYTPVYAQRLLNSPLKSCPRVSRIDDLRVHQLRGTLPSTPLTRMNSDNTEHDAGTGLSGSDSCADMTRKILFSAVKDHDVARLNLSLVADSDNSDNSSSSQNTTGRSKDSSGGSLEWDNSADLLNDNNLSDTSQFIQDLIFDTSALQTCSVDKAAEDGWTSEIAETLAIRNSQVHYSNTEAASPTVNINISHCSDLFNNVSSKDTDDTDCKDNKQSVSVSNDNKLSVSVSNNNKLSVSESKTSVSSDDNSNAGYFTADE